MKCLYLESLVALLWLFLDFSAGVFVVYVLGYMRHEVSIIDCFVGGIIALLPDLLSLAYMYFKKGKVYDDHHQFFAHRPLSMIPLATVLGFLLGGLFWAVVALCCFFWHFVHDTENILSGGGIAWGYPFLEEYISPWRVVDPKDSIMGKESKRDHNEWLDEVWLKPSFISVTEISLGALMTSFLVWKLFFWELSVLSALFVWSVVTETWAWRSFLRRHRKFFFEIKGGD